MCAKREHSSRCLYPRKLAPSDVGYLCGPVRPDGVRSCRPATASMSESCERLLMDQDGAPVRGWELRTVSGVPACVRHLGHTVPEHWHSGLGLWDTGSHPAVFIFSVAVLSGSGRAPTGLPPSSTSLWTWRRLCSRACHHKTSLLGKV